MRLTASTSLALVFHTLLGCALLLALSFLMGCSAMESAKYTNPNALENLYVESLNEAALPAHDFNVTYQFGRNAEGRRSSNVARLEITFPLGYINTHNRISETPTQFLGSMECGTAAQLAAQDFAKKVTCRTSSRQGFQIEKMNNDFAGRDVFFSAACLGTTVGSCDELVLVAATGEARENSVLRSQHGRAIHLVRQVIASTSSIGYGFSPQITDLSRQSPMTLNQAIDALRNTGN